MPSNYVDLIVTDPPYKTITGGRNNGKNHKRPKGVLNDNNGLFKHQTDIKIDDWIGELFRVLKEESHCYIFTNHLNMEDMLTKSREAGFKLHNILVWEKNNCTPSQWYMKIVSMYYCYARVKLSGLIILEIVKLYISLTISLVTNYTLRKNLLIY